MVVGGWRLEAGFPEKGMFGVKCGKGSGSGSRRGSQRREVESVTGGGWSLFEVAGGGVESDGRKWPGLGG